MAWHVLTKQQQQQQKSIRQCLVGLEIAVVGVVCSICVLSSGSLQILVSGHWVGSRGRDAEWPLGPLGQWEPKLPKSSTIDNSHNFCTVIFFCFKSKDTESFHGFKAHFLVKFCAASIIEVLNYTDIKSPGQSAAPPYSLGLTTFSMVSVVFLFVHPKQHKCRIFLFRPCRMNKGVMLTAPTKGRSPVVSCGADRTCSQPCSKLVLPSPACCAGQAAAEQAGMAAMGRQGLEGKQRIKTSSSRRESALINCLLASTACPGGELPFVCLLQAQIPRGTGRGRALFLHSANCAALH